MANRSPRTDVEVWHGHHGALATVPTSGRELAAYRRAQVAELARQAQERRRVIGAVGLPPGVFVAGEVLHHVPYGLPASLALAVVPLARPGFERLRDLRRGKRLEALSRWQRAALGVRLGTAAYLPTAAAIGTFGPVAMRDGLLAGWVAGGAYLWRNRRRPVVESPIPDPVVVWSDLVGCPGGALAGSHLAGLEQRDDRWTATVELVRGKQEWKDVVGALGKISSAYDTPAERITVEPVRARPAAAKITVFRRMPLLTSPVWPGPHLLDLENGTAPFVQYTDGSYGVWRWWAPGGGMSGAQHGLVAGTTGAGKSSTLGLKLAYERSTPLIVSWVADPQGGQSLPEWVDQVDWYARSMDEIRVMMHALRKLMYSRSERLANERWTDDKGRHRIGRSTFIPRPDLPLIAVTIDEAHRVLDPNDGAMVALLDEFARMGRKCGISLTLATQMPTLGDLQKMSLREQIAGGNVMCLRTGSRVSGSVIATQPLPSDPYELPKEVELDDGRTVGTGGLGFFLGGAGRPAVCRVMDLGDEYEHANRGETTALPADDGQVLEAFAGDAYRNRRDRNRPAVRLEDLPGVGGTERRSDPVRAVSTAPALMPRPSEQPKTREMALKVLRGSDRVLSSTEVGSRLRALGIAITDSGVANALARCEKDGQVMRLPKVTTGPDRADRWQAVS
jgi:hypothetical protein